MGSAETPLPGGARLVDYLAVIGFDEKRARHGMSVGEVVQRFPVDEWPDTPFLHGLEVFCQPQGWVLKSTRSSPSFFVSTLTDMGADRHYAACLSFHEPRVADKESDNYLDDDDDEDTSVSPSKRPFMEGPVLYRPKCLVIVSRRPFFELFRNCLNVLFAAYMNGPKDEASKANHLEKIVANLVSGVRLPPPSGPSVSFSLSNGDRHSIRPPQSETVPVTGGSIAMLLQQLGTIHNLLCVFCAVLTDRKILFHSTSYNRLSDACYALVSLVYPLKYPHTYVPLLPETVLEVLESPTPFVMGVHSSLKPKTVEVLDLISVDLDCGSVFAPEHVNVPPIPEPYYGRLLACLQMVLDPGLSSADDALQSGEPPQPPIEVVDKRIRACFVRLFADLLVNYRTCLQVIRLHARPYIVFHKAAFMGLRGFQDDPFMIALLDGQIFQSFINERGLPYRVCDLFDDVCASYEDQIRNENGDNGKAYYHVVSLADRLMENETQERRSGLSTPITRERSLSLLNQVPPPFPELNADEVAKLITENLESARLCNRSLVDVPLLLPKEVPSGPRNKNRPSVEANGPNLRRLDVLRNCVRCIFENKVSDARKMLSAVQLSMKSVPVRVAFCQELYENLHPTNRATLEPQQFDLLVRLMNCALQNESEKDEHGIAYALLSLSNTYCRRLTPGVHQFAYTCIQEHPVWSNPQFWEAAFYHDVHLQIRQLYLPSGAAKAGSSCPYGTGLLADTWNLFEEPTALQIASDRMKQLPSLDERTMAARDVEEQSLLSGQAKHFTNLMVCMRTPLDASRLRRVNINDLEQRSVMGSHVSGTEDNRSDDASSVNSDVESGFADGTVASDPIGDLGDGTVRWIAKFLDRVCSDAGLPPQEIDQLHSRIPGFVALHVENLEQVHRESKRLPPIHKPKLLVPALLPGERMVHGHLRVFLLPDGRADVSRYVERTQSGSLLPAEGAIFLTNYRIIFKGQPCDPYICEQVVVRSLPVMSMTKDKLIGQQYLFSNQMEPGGTVSKTQHHLHDALQIRSSTFQLLKIAFDEEVTPEKVETFVNDLDALRWPETVTELFPIANAGIVHPAFDHAPAPKNKFGTIRDIKKTLLRTAVKTGFSKAPTDNKKSKYEPNTMPPRATPVRARSAVVERTFTPPRSASEDSADRDALDVGTNGDSGGHRTLVKTVDRLPDRLYIKDFERLGLITQSDLAQLSDGRLGSPFRHSSPHDFRLTKVNEVYSLCHSYPPVLVVPSKVTDDSIKKIAKGFKHNRFPVVTWCSRGGALLLRGAGIVSKNVVSRLKKQAVMLGAAGIETQQFSSPHQLTSTSTVPAGSLRRLHQGSTNNIGPMKSSVEQERYLACLTTMSPSQAPLGADSFLSASVGSLLSMDSLMLSQMDSASIGSSTPDPHRRAGSSFEQFGRQAANLVRNSGGRNGGGKTMSMSGRFGSMHPQNNPPLPASKRSSGYGSTVFGSSRTSFAIPPQCLSRAAFYIFGEKAHAKMLKLEKSCEFIPIQYPTAHDTKAAFKKFLRIAAPSTLPSEEASNSHMKLLEDTGWMQLICSLLQVTGAVVDLVDIQNSSVALCLEDGWDATVQISALAQVLLDPYYRTLAGFHALVEKEWLAFGHRFSHRANHTIATQSSGVAPVFVVFLDAVHQVLNQYPAAFEFNDFYLRFLAFHSTAAYFQTFLLDSDAERAEMGLSASTAAGKSKGRKFDVRIQSPIDEDDGGFFDNNGKRADSSAPPDSIWEYVMQKSSKSSLFFNFCYMPDAHGVIRPQCSLAALDLWSFYCEDFLSHGSPYDLDAAEMEMQERQTDRSNVQDVIGIGRSTRRVVDLAYDAEKFALSNAFQSLLEDHDRLLHDLDSPPVSWSDVLQDAAEQMAVRPIETTETIERTHGDWLSWLQRALHKKDTVKLLMRGLNQQSSASRLRDSSGSSPHHFQQFNFTAPEYCLVCNRILWGVVVRHGLRCSVCGYKCHEKCLSSAPLNCMDTAEERTNRPIQEEDRQTESPEPVSESAGAPPVLTPVDKQRTILSDLPTHQGYLMKRGATFKMWKPRWFVLDSTKHQLRYYDSDTDPQCKGLIDLSEVKTVEAVASPQMAPKRPGGSAYFDIRTTRRTYTLLANTKREADEWIEKIQASLQE